MSSYLQRIGQMVGHELLVLPSVTVLVFDDSGGVLLVQHSGTGKWVAPGGMVEPDEDPATAARREMLEETGCDVRLERIRGVYGGPDFRVRYQNGDEVSYVMTVYEAELIGGEPAPNRDETAAVRYVSPPELEHLDIADWLGVVLRPL